MNMPTEFIFCLGIRLQELEQLNLKPHHIWQMLSPAAQKSYGDALRTGGESQYTEYNSYLKYILNNYWDMFIFYSKKAHMPFLVEALEGSIDMETLRKNQANPSFYIYEKFHSIMSFVLTRKPIVSNHGYTATSNYYIPDIIVQAIQAGVSGTQIANLFISYNNHEERTQALINAINVRKAISEQTNSNTGETARTNLKRTRSNSPDFCLSDSDLENLETITDPETLFEQAILTPMEYALALLSQNGYQDSHVEKRFNPMPAVNNRYSVSLSKEDADKCLEGLREIKNKMNKKLTFTRHGNTLIITAKVRNRINEKFSASKATAHNSNTPGTNKSFIERTTASKGNRATQFL